MANANDALLRMESGQTSYALVALTNSGDATTYTGAAKPWSRKNGFDATITPNGVINGGTVSAAASGSDNVIDYTALNVYLAGVSTAVSGGTDLAVTRATAADTHKISSITVTSAGAVAVIAGTNSTSFTETRGAAGGPPYIPAGSVEVAQVRLIGSTAAPVAASDIFQAEGLHLERYDYPAYTVDYFNGQVKFDAALPTIHTGDVTKSIYGSYAVPIFSDLQRVSDVVVPEESYSVSSEVFYGGTLNSTSTSLGQGSFTILTSNGVTDPVVKAKGQTLWFEFLPNKYRSEKIQYQGILGVTRSFPTSGSISSSCTVSAESKAQDVEI
ncbi:MAG: hypothetical protein ACPGF7_09555 [Pontibacterium sp.]